MDRFSKYCKVISGYAFKAKDLMEEGDIPVVKIGNISNGGNVNISSNTQYVDRSFLSLDEKYHIKNKDILISLTGSHMNQPNSMVGRSCRSYNKDTYLLNQRAGKVIPFDNADKDYLYYLLSSEEMKYSIVIRAYGAANQVNISPSDIEGIKWNFPEYDVQCKIGKILSTYDDLIEKNNRKIEILQDMAEELYKEWFVRFRFPGYKTAKFTDGIPDGWEYGRISNLCNLKNGYAFPSSSFENIGSYGIIKIENVLFGDINIDKCSYVSNIDEKKLSSFKLNSKDILIAMTGAQIGKTGRFPNSSRTFYLNQRVGKFVPNNPNIINNQYLYQYTQTKAFITYIENYANGAAQPNISGKQIENIKILIPTNDLLRKYELEVDSMLNNIQLLKEQNNNLKQQRDLLLPRLMSGKLEVKVKQEV